MARFKYLGEPPRPGLVVSYGPCVKIRVPYKNGTIYEHVAPNQATGFVIGQDTGIEYTDQRCLRMMRVDPRFQEIV